MKLGEASSICLAPPERVSYLQRVSARSILIFTTYLRSLPEHIRHRMPHALRSPTWISWMRWNAFPRETATAAETHRRAKLIVAWHLSELCLCNPCCMQQWLLAYRMDAVETAMDTAMLTEHILLRSVLVRSGCMACCASRAGRNTVCACARSICVRVCHRRKRRRRCQCLHYGMC